MFRLIATPLSVQLAHLSGPRGQPAVDPYAGESPVAVAAEVARLSHRISHGQFVLVGGTLTYAAYFPHAPVVEFVQALPRGYRIVASTEVPGFAGVAPVHVYVFDRRGQRG